MIASISCKAKNLMMTWQWHLNWSLSFQKLFFLALVKLVQNNENKRLKVTLYWFVLQQKYTSMSFNKILNNHVIFEHEHNFKNILLLCLIINYCIPTVVMIRNITKKKMRHKNNGKQNKTRTKPKRQLIMNLSITVECSFFVSSSSNQKFTG